VAPVHESATAQDASAETLGDVLYADKSTTGPSEKDWVDLVRARRSRPGRAAPALRTRTPRSFHPSHAHHQHRATAEEVTLDVFHAVWQGAAGCDPANGTVLGWMLNQAAPGPSTASASSSG